MCVAHASNSRTARHGLTSRHALAIAAIRAGGSERTRHFETSVSLVPVRGREGARVETNAGQDASSNLVGSRNTNISAAPLLPCH